MSPIPAIDLHVDTLQRLVEKECAFGGRQPALQVDGERAHAGGVRLLGCACFTADGHEEPARNVDRMLQVAQRENQDPASPLKRVTHPDQLQGLASDQIGMLLTIENAVSLEGDLQRLQHWYEHGVRIVGLTWNQQNDLASGTSVTHPKGLSSLGRAVVDLCAQLGIAIDVSHLSAPAVDEVLAQGVPVLATHCNARAVHDHTRNLTDVQLKGIARNGGVVGLNFYPPFLGAGQVTSHDVARHARHIADVVGEDRLALGSDFDGIERTPQDLESHRQLPQLAAALTEVGFSSAAIEGIFSVNFLRCWERWCRS